MPGSPAKKPRAWSVEPSAMALRTRNPIREVVDGIRMPAEPVKPMLKLSLGDPTVFDNLGTPDVLVEAVVAGVQSREFDGYCNSAGTDAARAAIAERYGVPDAPLTPADVVIGSGCSGAITLALQALIGEGDNVLIPAPGFALYEVVAQSHGAESRFYNLLPEQGWEADLAHLESQINESTKCIVVNNPSNPCGSVYSREHLQAILAVAERHQVVVLADEIYGELVFEGQEFVPLASLTDSVPILAVGGIAKNFVCPGWRVGWVLVHDHGTGALDRLRPALHSLTQVVLGANTLVQAALPRILTPASDEDRASLAAHHAHYLGTLQSNAQFTVERLGAVDGLTVVVPQGAMYVMVGLDLARLDIEDDMDFTQKLLDEQAVFVLPGQCFKSPGFFRVVLSGPQEMLAEAYGRIEEFVGAHLS